MKHVTHLSFVTAVAVLAMVIGLTADTFAAKPSSTTTDAVDLRSWSKKIDDAAQRFIVLDAFNGEAVLDLETQLVWHKTPGPGKAYWLNAMSSCMGSRIGGRGGWRLPAMEELTSLIDPSQNNPPLPSGHPFDVSNITGDVWSTTTVPDTFTAWTQDVTASGYLGGAQKDVYRLNFWCVRGGRGIEGM